MAAVSVNAGLGYVMIALAVPAAIALVAFVRASTGRLLWIGPSLYIAFIALEVVVDYVRPVEFHPPIRISILVPSLMLLLVRS